MAIQLQPQTQTTRHQRLSKLKVWLKAKLPSSSDGNSGQNSAAAAFPPQRVASVQKSSPPATLRKREKPQQANVAQTQAIKSSFAQISVDSTPPRVTTSQVSKDQSGRKSDVYTPADKKFETEEQRALALIRFHRSAQDALIWAVEKKHQRAISCLLDYSIRDAKPIGFRRCLSLALQQSNSTLLGRLLDAAKESKRLEVLLVDPDLLRTVTQNVKNDRLDSLLNGLDDHGKRQVMCIAVEHAISGVVSKLLAMGTNPNTCFDGRSILPQAILIKHMDNISSLLNFPNINVNALAKERSGEVHLKSAIEVATATRNIPVLELMLKRDDIDVNLANSDGSIALVTAVQIGAGTQALTLLLKRSDIDVNKTGGEGCTALHAAVRVANLPAIELLLEHKDIDINRTNSIGSTVLHLAVKAKCYYLVTLLHNHGAEINKADNQGNTALHMAAKIDSVPLVDLLLKYGANTLQRNRENQQAVHVAGDEGNEAVFNFFRKRIGLPPVTAVSSVNSHQAAGAGSGQSYSGPWPDRLIWDGRTREYCILSPGQPVYWC